MPTTSAGFVDAGYLRAQGAAAIGRKPREVRLDAASVVAWLQSCVSEMFDNHSLLRTYWYDGAFNPSHFDYPGQRKFFDAIAFTPGIQLRLGQIAEQPVHLDGQLRRAVRQTAESLGMEPDTLLGEFKRQMAGLVRRQQKGVDTLIVLDLVRLASRSIFSSMILVSGDRDLAEAVRTAQDYGTQIIVATPDRPSVASALAQLADDIIDIPDDAIRSMLPMRQPRE